MVRDRPKGKTCRRTFERLSFDLVSPEWSRQTVPGDRKQRTTQIIELLVTESIKKEKTTFPLDRGK